MTKPWERDWGAANSAPPQTQTQKPWERDWDGATQQSNAQQTTLSGGGRIFKVQRRDGRTVAIRATNMDEAKQIAENGIAGAAKQQALDQPFIDQQKAQGNSLASSALVGAGQGLTFNLMDEAVGAANTLPTVAKALSPFHDEKFSDIPQAYRDNKQEIQDQFDSAREYAPKTYFAGEIGGGLIGAGKVLKGATMLPKVGGVANSVLNTAAKGNIFKSLGANAMIGSGLGAIDAYGRDQNILEGALFGGIGGAVGKGLVDKVVMPFVSKAAGVFSKKPQIPTLEEVTSKANSLYNNAGQNGLTATQAETTALASKIKDISTKEGLISPTGRVSEAFPKAREALNVLDDYSNGTMNVQQMQAVRDILADARNTTGGKENRIASMFLKEFDNFVHPKAPDLKEARSLWSRVAKVKEIDELLGSAELRASTGGTGANAQNAMRQNLRRFAERGHALTKDESAALRKVITGTGTQNFLRELGSYSPQGVIKGAVSIGGGAAAGNAIGGPVGAGIGAVGLPAVGYASKKISERIANKNVQSLLDIILAGGSKAATQKAPNAIQLLLQGKSPKISYHSSLLGALMGEKQGTQESPLMKALKGK